MKVGTPNTRGRLSAGEVAQNPSSQPLFVFPPRLIEIMTSGSCCSKNKESMPSSSPSCGKRAFGVGTTEEGLVGEVDHVKRLRVAYESFTKSHPESTSLSSGPIRLPSLLVDDNIQPLDRPTIPARNHLGDHRLSAVDVIQEVLRGIIDSPKGQDVKNLATTSSKPAQADIEIMPSMAEQGVDFSIDELYTVFSSLEPQDEGVEERQATPTKAQPSLDLGATVARAPGGNLLQAPLPHFSEETYNRAPALPTSLLQPRSLSSNLVGSRNLRHPLSPASRDTVIACSDLTMSQSSSSPMYVLPFASCCCCPAGQMEGGGSSSFVADTPVVTSHVTVWSH